MNSRSNNRSGSFGFSCSNQCCGDTLKKGKASVATVMTDVFHKNEINLLRKFAKIVRIFDKIDDPQNRGVI
jgi:hypothetical protein